VVEAFAVRAHQGCAAYYRCENPAHPVLADEADFIHSTTKVVFLEVVY